MTSGSSSAAGSPGPTITMTSRSRTATSATSTRLILTRDLVQKSSPLDSTVLGRLAEYMMGNSGDLNSPSNIANALDANRVPTNHVTVG